jgi:type II secretory ATPase GspE/PulE/Tfp pilus assembly ATPase PilB-like protein
VRSKLGEALVGAGVVADADLADALADANRRHEPLGAVLVERRLVTERQLASALAAQLALRFVDLHEEPVDPEALRMIPPSLARKHLCVGFRRDQRTITVAMANPMLLGLADELERMLGLRVVIAVAPGDQIRDVLDASYPSTGAASAAPAPQAEERDGRGEEITADELLARASERGASELRVDTSTGSAVACVWSDDVLLEAFPFATGVTLRRQLAHLAGIADGGQSAAGRFVWRGRECSFSIGSMIAGERFVVRFKGSRRPAPSIRSLGLTDSQRTTLDTWVAATRGVIAVAGNRGQGATATVAALTQAAMGRCRAAWSIESSPEYAGEARRIEVARTAEAVSAAVRTACDGGAAIITVIGMPEVAIEVWPEILAAARQALVVCELRADDSVDAINQLRERSTGEELRRTVQGVVSPRVVRRLCEHCRQRVAISEAAAAVVGLTSATAGELPFFAASGCALCDYSGYRGTAILLETLAPEAMDRLLTGPPGGRSAAAGAGYVSALDAALAAAANGTASADEVVRAAFPAQAAGEEQFARVSRSI